MVADTPTLTSKQMTTATNVRDIEVRLFHLRTPLTAVREACSTDTVFYVRVDQYSGMVSLLHPAL
jgi:hypothetical protein